MKVYIELDGETPAERIKRIDTMLKDRNLRGQMHLLLDKWKNNEGTAETKMITDA